MGSTLDELGAVYPGLSDVRYEEIEGYQLPYVYVRSGNRTLAFQFDTDTHPDADSKVQTMVLARKRPQVLWVAC